MKILKHGTVVIQPDGHVTFTDFTIDVEGKPPDFKAMARLALDDAYQRGLAALGETVILDATPSNAVH